MWHFFFLLITIHAVEVSNWNQEPPEPNWTGCTSKQLNPAKWMCQLQMALDANSPKLNSLNLPATHDSAAKSGRGITADAVCQYANINTQLKMGYRWFDLRVIYDPTDRHFWMVHYDNKFINWDHLHAQLKSFRINSGGTECIILSVKNEMGKEKYWKESIYKDRNVTKEDFAVPFIEKVKKYQSSEDPNDRIYFVEQANAPTLKQCKGRVILQGMKGKAGATNWHKDVVWKTFNPLGSNWKDEKPEDNKDWDRNWDDKNDRVQRLTLWKQSLDAVNKIDIHQIETTQFYRSEINANSMRNKKFEESERAKTKCKSNDGKWEWKQGCGIPVDWAKIMNPDVIKEIAHRSFSMEGCVQTFDGIIAIDMPTKNVKGKEIAKVIILSNCPLYNKIAKTKRDAKTFKKRMARLASAKLDEYGEVIYHYYEEASDYDYNNYDEYQYGYSNNIHPMFGVIAICIAMIIVFVIGAVCGVFIAYFIINIKEYIKELLLFITF